MKVQRLPNPGAAKPLSITNVTDFNGGLNTVANRFDLEQNESPWLMNLDVDRRGGLNRRPGVLGTSTAPTAPGTYPANFGGPYPGHGIRFRNATWHLFFPVSSGLWEYIDYYANASPYTGVGSGSGTNIILRPSQKVQGGTTTPLLSSLGTTWQDSFSSPSGGHQPSAAVGCGHRGVYLFVANTVESIVGAPPGGFPSGGLDGYFERFPNRLRWSHPGDPGSWRSIDYIDIGAYRDPITAVISAGDHLVIFQDRTVHILYGSSADNWQLVNVSHTVGAAGYRSVCKGPDGTVYFVDQRRGLMSVSGGQLRWLSEKVNDQFQSFAQISAGADFEGSNFELVAGYGCGYSTITDRVWVSTHVSTAGQATGLPERMCLVYDTVTGAWTRNNIFVDAFEPDDGPSAGYLYGFTGADDTYATQMVKCEYTKDETPGTNDSYITAGSFYVATRYDSPWFTASQPVVPKRWMKPEFIINYGDYLEATVSVYKNYDTSTVDRTINIAPQSGFTNDESDAVFRTQTLGSGRSMAFRWSTAPDASTNDDIYRLDGYAIKSRTKSVRS